ncbi:MAG: hypothetical protein Q4D50_13150 [Eubacteriales bacterium]|nr:hypothetical protein [Eubacteriales bacterium]
MRRFLVALVCLTLICSILTLPATAAEFSEMHEDGQVVVGRTVEYLENGYYIIETIYKPIVQLYNNTTSGTKIAQCYSSGTLIFTVQVNGTFTYDGSTAEATSATGSVKAYVSGVTLESKDAYTSGASAYATASVSYGGTTLSKTVKLTCDKDGNLS